MVLGLLGLGLGIGLGLGVVLGQPLRLKPG